MLPDDAQNSLGFVPVGSVGCSICQVDLVTISYPSLHTPNIEVAVPGSIGVEEMVDCLLPGIRGLLISWSIEGSDEGTVQSHIQLFNVRTLHMVSFKPQTVTGLTDLDACVFLLSPSDED